MGRQQVLSPPWITHVNHNMYNASCPSLWISWKKSLFYLKMPLEHIAFHIINNWMSNIRSLWHISFRGSLLSPHRVLFPISSKGSFICTSPKTWQRIPQPLMDQFSMENSPNYKCIRHAGSIRLTGGSKPLQLSVLLLELFPTSVDLLIHAAECPSLTYILQ